jgi:hypothetical protein
VRGDTVSAVRGEATIAVARAVGEATLAVARVDVVVERVFAFRRDVRLESRPLWNLPGRFAVAPLNQ